MSRVAPFPQTLTPVFHAAFKHYLSIYAAWHHWRPDKIFLHTNAYADSISRVQNGTSGKWNQLILDISGLVLNNVTAPTHPNNGRQIKNIEHRSDFVRVKTVHDFGGVYIGFDVYPLRDVRILQGKMIGLWKKGMHDKYTGGWATHSNKVITCVSERLTREIVEMLIMEREAFAPGSWYMEDEKMLWATHREGKSNLANITQGDDLPVHEEVPFDEWSRNDGPPGWARDWSCTYMLRAFTAICCRSELRQD